MFCHPSNPKRRIATVFVFMFLLTISFTGIYRTLHAAPRGQDPYPPPGQDGQPYPTPGDVPILATVAPLDLTINQAEELSVPGTATQPAGNALTGLIMLWLGFIATLLVLIAAIIGSVLLFTRRNDH
jgi:uncharacterized iron-regulated membrane protein